MTCSTKEQRARTAGLTAGAAVVSLTAAVGSTLAVAAGAALGVLLWYFSSVSLVTTASAFAGRASRGLLSGGLIGVALILRWPVLFGLPFVVGHFMDFSIWGFLAGFKISLIAWATTLWLAQPRQSSMLART